MEDEKNDKTFEITREWLHAHKTLRGGWTKKQVSVLGVVWPLENGWTRSIHLMKITQEQRRAFEAFAPGNVWA